MSQNNQNPENFKEMDIYLQRLFKEDEPGVSVIVTQNNETVFRKSYGLANLEWELPLQPDHIFRLGSITKQFTAVAILKLFERGQLDLQEDIKTFLPNYPTHGYHISVEHLLTHTSGIKSYTNLPEWLALFRTDFKVEEMIEKFCYHPMEFSPGSKFNYNNSSYFLLGAIIEKVSGQTYAQYIEENIFKPLGMKNSCYDMTDRIIPRRVAGYKLTPDGFRNADYLSMSQPYAAGSLASNVDDLAIWDAALYTEKLLKQETLQMAWKPYTLSSGETTRYGYGWAIADFEGTRVIKHSGGIHGFINDAIRLPDEKIYAAVLSNRGIPFPDILTYQLASIAAGKPHQEPQSVNIPSSKLEKHKGVYLLENVNYEIPVSFIDGQLQAPIPMAASPVLHPLSENEFFLSNSIYRISMQKDKEGNTTAMILNNCYGPRMTAKKIK